MSQKEKSYYFHFHKDDVTWPFSASPVSGAPSYGKWIFSSLFSAGNLLQSHAGQVCLMHNHSHVRLLFQFVSCIKSFQRHFKNISHIKAIFTMMSFYHCYKNSTFVYLSHWNVQRINPIDIKTIKKSYRDINQHLKQKLQFNNLIYTWKKYTLFLENKKLIKKQNCLLNELSFITDCLNFL